MNASNLSRWLGALGVDKKRNKEFQKAVRRTREELSRDIEERVKKIRR